MGDGSVLPYVRLVDFLDEPTLRRRLDDYGFELRPLRIEVAVITNDRLIELSRYRGTSRSVTLPKIRSGLVLLHNHPHGWRYPYWSPRRAGNSFSPQDIEYACQANLFAIVAFSPGFTFLAGRVGHRFSDRFWVDELLPEFRAATAEVSAERSLMVKHRVITRTQFEATFWHLVWSRVSQRTSLLYITLEAS